MFDLIVELHTLFPSKLLHGSIFKWHEENIDNDSVPMRFKKFVLSIKRKALWKDNKDLGLVLVGAYKNRNCSDILEHIASYVHRTYDDDDNCRNVRGSEYEGGYVYHSGRQWYSEDGYDSNDYEYGGYFMEYDYR